MYHLSYFIFFVFILATVFTAAVLQIDDDLTNWDEYWADSNSVEGVTSSVNYYSSPIDGRYTAFRVSICPEDDAACYQSELKNSTTLDTEGEYWFGVRNYLTFKQIQIQTLQLQITVIINTITTYF